MNRWKFILIDRNGVRTEIPEPINWIDPEVVVSRDNENNWHGIFFDYGVDKLTFIGLGFQLIKTEYDVYGINGKMKLDIQFQCSEDNLYDTFYEGGTLAFDEYSDICGDDCSVTIGIADSLDLILFKNNYEQTVNLNSNIAFDQETVLTDYDYLNFDLEIPNRGLPQTVGGNSPGAEHSIYPIEVRLLTPIAGTQIRIRPELTENSVAEIADSDPVGTYSYQVFPQTSPNLYPTALSPFLELNQSVECSTGMFNYKLRLKGHIKEQAGNIRDIRIFIVVINEPWSDLGDTTLHEVEILPETTYTPGVGPDMDFDQSFEGSCIIEDGNPFIAFINFMTFYGTTVDQFVWVDWDKETSLNLTSVSNCEPTTAKSYMINEVASRVVEAVTNDNIRFYSTTFGRTDSQPYAINYNPCAGLFAINNGLNLRRKLLVDGTQPKFFISPKQLFEGLNPLWNIGLTIEPDPNRPGFNRLRFEDWRYFYQEDVAIRFNDAPKVERVVDVDRCFNQLSIGYNKWEAEGTTGLYEFMTKRAYRINVNSINNINEQLTDFICSPYTVEITRRKDKGTEDWKYDNDIFGFCLKEVDGEYSVETFLESATDITNVIDSSSCYNGRISPARCALRWFDYTMQGFKTILPYTKLIFSKGDGNYVASFKLTTCSIEGKTMSESEDIDLTDFEDIQSAKPPTYAEIVSFDHPMNYNTFKRIKNDPTIRYKSISYRCNGTDYYGWIDEIRYRPIAGMASIKIIPRSTSIVVPPPEPTCSATVSNLQFTPAGDGKMTITWEIGVPGATFYQLTITKNGEPYSTLNHSALSITLAALQPGTYNVIVLPFCDVDLPGANYEEGNFTISAPSFALTLSAVLTNRSSNNRLQLTATGSASSPYGFSFKFGECVLNTSSGITYCVGYPGSLIPTPTAIMNFNTGDTIKMVEGGQATAGASFGSITKVVLYDLVGITPAQITKAVGQTWTLEFM